MTASLFKVALNASLHALAAMGPYADEDSYHEEMIKFCRLYRRKDHPEYAEARCRLAKLYEAKDRLSDAERLSKQAIEWYRRWGSKGDHDFTMMVQRCEAFGQDSCSVRREMTGAMVTMSMAPVRRDLTVDYGGV